MNGRGEEGRVGRNSYKSCVAGTSFWLVRCAPQFSGRWSLRGWFGVSNKTITSGFQEGAIEEDKLSMTALFKTLHASYLLKVHWPVQVMWSSPVFLCVCVCMWVRTRVLCMCVCIGVQNGVNVGRNGSLRATKEQTYVVKDRWNFVFINMDK